MLYKTRIRNLQSSIRALLLITTCFSCSENNPYSKTIKIQDDYFDGEVTVEKIYNIHRNKISITNTITGGSDRIYTPYEIFDLETGDMNHNGKTDICLGIIKPTPFDSVLRKRLFIFQIDQDFIRPLWLSSRLVYPLEEFNVLIDAENQYIIRTIEQKDMERYCISEYKWESFGMTFIKELNDSLTYSEAEVILNGYR